MPGIERANHDLMQEAELVRLARRGDRDAFRVIMQRGNQRLFRVARGIVRNDAEAEDVLQEAYAHAFAAIGRFRGDAGIMTWLVRITMNEARMRLRRDRRRPTVTLDQVEAVQMSAGQIIPFPSSFGAEDPEVDAARVQVRRLIERAVDGLPERFRIVFILRDIDECSIEETAAQLDIRPETVKTRLHRARRLLRVALHETLASSLLGAFPFLGARCRRMTEAVLARLGEDDRAGTFPAR